MTEDVPSLGETPSSFHRGTGHPAGPSLLSPCPGCVCGFLSSRGALLGLAVMVGGRGGPGLGRGADRSPRPYSSPPPLHPWNPAPALRPARTTTPLPEESRPVFSGDSKCFSPRGPDGLVAATRLWPLRANVAVAVTGLCKGWGRGSRAMLEA